MADKLHYFLIAGLVGISIPTEVDGVKQDIPSSIPVNAIVRHDSMNFPAHRLGRAQQNLTKSFVTKVPDEIKEVMSIIDVVLTSISYLGFMSEEEFQAEAPDLAQPAIPQTI